MKNDNKETLATEIIKEQNKMLKNAKVLIIILGIINILLLIILYLCRG